MKDERLKCVNIPAKIEEKDKPRTAEISDKYYSKRSDDNADPTTT